MRRRVPWWLLALLFIGIPVIEIYLIVALGQVVGAWWTIAVIIAAGVLGSWLIKREGGRAWRAFTDALSSGRAPSRELADGALILVGGTLLLTPGFLTDAVGLVCVLPFTRPWPRRLLVRVIARRLVVVTSRPPGQPGTPRSPAGGYGDPEDPPVVRGDVVE